MKPTIEELLGQIDALRRKAQWLHEEHERLCVQFTALLDERIRLSRAPLFDGCARHDRWDVTGGTC
jgi:hypothetical protein